MQMRLRHVKRGRTMRWGTSVVLHEYSGYGNRYDSSRPNNHRRHHARVTEQAKP
jgi:hypothetical protein